MMRLALQKLGADDEGFDPIGINITPADIFNYFEAQVQQREIALARTLLAR